MKKVLLDTNIYGEIVKEKDPYKILESISLQKKFVFYGIKNVIRKEIKNTPKDIKIKNRSLRIFLLNFYDAIIKEHEFELTEDIQFLAERYYDAYREFGGSKSKDSVITDFFVVACASLKRMDIVVSNDNHTMLTENAIRAYNLINKTKNIRIPWFINYLEFRRRLFSL